MSGACPAPLSAVFMGTPAFAATILSAVLDSSRVNLLGVYTQPDRPSGRGKRLKASAVKELALLRGLPVYQPPHFRPGPEGDAAFETLQALKPDVLLVAAYGLLLPQRVLDIPRHMPINVHASLLPKYRGAAPIQRAIMNRDPFTGITIMRMEAALDSGPILLQRALGIGLNDTAAAMHDELALLGGALLVEALDRLAAGSLKGIEQDAARATHAAKLDKSESFLDLRLPAHDLHARLRGLTPWPGGTLMLRRQGQEDLAVAVSPGCFPVTGPMPDSASSNAPAPDASPSGTSSSERPFSDAAASGASFSNASFSDSLSPGPGSIRPPSSFAVQAGTSSPEEALLVRCGDGWYAFPELRPAGKKSMSGRAFFNGYLKDSPDARFLLPGAVSR